MPGLGALLGGETTALHAEAAAWAALAYLVPLGSVVVSVLFLVVVGHWEASRAAYAGVIIPFVTAAAAALVLAEPESWAGRRGVR
ncbi:MAG: hypothetical protein ACRD0D_05070 [Acidimicrobiales bacterium]